MTMNRRNFLHTSVAVVTGAVAPLPARAQQDYPNHPVRIVVGFPAGGGTDVFARVVAQGLSQATGQQFLIDNKAGAGGIVASQGMQQAAADGYTLLVGSTSTQVIAPLLYSRRPYSTADFNSGSSQWSTISRDNLQAADAMVYRSGGSGHIFVYGSGDGWGSPYAYECKGCSYGCVEGYRSASSAYKAIRRSGY